jgi:hypothetical protein
VSDPRFFSKPVAARALGELVVIVVGILLALGMDQWWSDRVDARTQHAYLTALHEDVATTINHLDGLIREFSALRDAASELSKQPPEGTTLSNAQLIELMGAGLFEIESFENGLSTHRDLKSTGRLGLITNAEIRRSLARVDQTLEEIDNAEADLLATQHQTVDPFLVAHTDLTLVAKAGYDTKERAAQMKRTGVVPADQLIGSGAGIDHRPLLADSRFRGIVALRIVLLTEVIVDYSDLKGLLVELRDEIAPRVEPRTR